MPCVCSRWYCRLMAVERSVSPLACDVHPAVSHRVLYQRRLEKTHSTGNDGTLSYSPQPTPPLSGTEDRSAYRYALATLLRWKASAPALGIHAFSSPRLTSKDFFAPGFWLVTYIREHSAAFDGRSPRIRVTCAFAPMWMDRARAPSCDSDDPALTLLVCSRRQQSFRAPPYFDVVYSGFIPRWRMAARSWTAKHEWYISLSIGNWIMAHLHHTLCISMINTRICNWRHTYQKLLR